MRTFLLLVTSLVTGAAHASPLDLLVGYPVNRVLLNASCQGLLGYASGVEGEYAIAKFREHRVRILKRADAEASVQGTFRADQTSRPRTLSRLAGHLRGVERWTASGQGEVYGFVLKGADAIEQHLRRLADTRDMIEAGLRKDSPMNQNLIMARLLVNTVSTGFLGYAATWPWGYLVAVPILGIMDPISANRAVFSVDQAARTFDRRLRANLGNPEVNGWQFASRTYRVRKIVLDAIRTRDPLEVVEALHEQNWGELNVTASTLADWTLRGRYGARADSAVRALKQNVFILVDQLLRFTPEPELVITVRMTDAKPKTVFERNSVKREGHVLGVTPTLR